MHVKQDKVVENMIPIKNYLYNNYPNFFGVLMVIIVKIKFDKNIIFLAYKTVPSSCAAYPLELYVVIKKAIYLYEPDNEQLKLI